MSKSPIGLLGGTFDPIHKGHLYVAKTVIDACSLDSIQFIPNRQPIHRMQPVASAEHRFVMVKLAIKNKKHFTVNDIEMKQAGPSFSIQTISKIRESMANRSICLILGADVFAAINTWKEWEKIPTLTNIIIINRPNAYLPKKEWLNSLLSARATQDVQTLHNVPSGHILKLEIMPIHVSGTEIREKLARRENVKDNLPRRVFQYIQKHYLYQSRFTK